MLARILKIVSSGVVVLLVVIAGLWFAARPKGELRLAVDAGQSEAEAKEVRGRFNSAHQKTNTVITFHNRLGLNEREIKTNPVPAQPDPSSRSLSDFVKFKENSFSFDAKVTKVEGEFNTNNIINSSYRWVGLYDYYVIFRNFARCSPSPQAAAADDCQQMTASLWPTKTATTSLAGATQNIEGNWRYIYSRLSWRTRSTASAWIQPGSSTSPTSRTTLPAWRPAPKGFSILQRGTSHPRCVSVSPDECRKLARDLFAEALRRDPTNRYAHLGMGLLKLRDVLQAARTGGRVLAVLRALSEPGNHLGAARGDSTVLAAFLDRQNSVMQFSLLELPPFPITSNFVASISNAARAYQAFVAADYEKQLGHSKRADLPGDLKSYLKGFEYEARLVLAETEEAALPLLEELAGLIKDKPSVWIYNIVYASHSCRYKRFEPAREALARALDIVATTSTPLFWDTHVWQAACLAKDEREAEAVSKIAAVLRYLDRVPENERLSREIQTIYLDLGYYFAGTKDYRAAKEFFLKAVEVNICFWPRIANDRQLRPFQKHAEYEDLRERVATGLGEAGAACGE